MPSSRAHPLIPRPVPAPGAALPTPLQPTGAPGADAAEARARAVRAGGFHESSYELRTGLDVIESEWPDGATLPGAMDGL